MKPIPILLAAFFAGIVTAFAQKPVPPAAPGTPPAAVRDPFAADPAADAAPQLPPECLVRMEVFALPHTDARKAMRQFPKQAALYAWLGAELEKEKSAVKLEHLTLLRVHHGQRAKLEQIAEYPYATGFDPPRIPQNVGIGYPATPSGSSVVNQVVPPPAPKPAPAPAPPVNKTFGPQGDPGIAGAPASPPPPPAGSVPASRVLPPWPYSPTTPTSYAMRNTGWTSEIELILSEDGRTADLNIAPEFCRLCGLFSTSASGEIMQPTFETNKFSTQIKAGMGQPTFAGTFGPPVSTGAEGGNTENVTRLFFITVTDPR